MRIDGLYRCSCQILLVKLLVKTLNDFILLLNDQAVLLYCSKELRGHIDILMTCKKKKKTTSTSTSVGQGGKTVC